ncbi:MAG: UDP-N-acetylglucosamine 2-epimerase (non-hydrolyzing), partial [Acidobacteriales bacterium]|nr:UDP-N-acetylglucosamine 2-epimerase (non-hydrolyzing) [Terriglobales bacterium]
MRKFVHVVGARPNFMKLAPVYRALAQRDGVQQIILHTGQHYDYNMSDVFFQQLGIPQPDVNLKVGSGTHAQQTAEVMVRFEAAMLEQKPDCVLVYGDVNSTVAAAMVCAKLLIPLAHVEAGLRSGDKTMPEEVNRVVTDRLADLLFTPSIDGNENLAKEGVPQERVHLVGNVMIDTLIDMMPAAQKIDLDHLPSNFILTTLHRPANVDDVAWLSGMIDLLERVSMMTPVVLPLHPRTRERLNSNNISLDRGQNFHVLEPRPYLEFLAL